MDTALRPAKEPNRPFERIFSYFTYRNQVATSGGAVLIQVVTQRWHISNSQATQQEIYLCTCNRRVFTCLSLFTNLIRHNRLSRFLPSRCIFFPNKTFDHKNVKINIQGLICSNSYGQTQVFYRPCGCFIIYAFSAHFKIKETPQDQKERNTDKGTG